LRLGEQRFPSAAHSSRPDAKNCQRAGMWGRAQAVSREPYASQVGPRRLRKGAV